MSHRKKKRETDNSQERFTPTGIKPRNDFERKLLEAEENGCAVAPPSFNWTDDEIENPDGSVEYFNPEYPNYKESMYVERLAGEILKLDRAVEGLVTAGREMMSQQVEQIQYIFEYMIKPQILGSDEVFEMERMLRALRSVCRLDEYQWKASLKARKRAIDMMRATTEVVVRRLFRNVVERASPESKKTSK